MEYESMLAETVHMRGHQNDLINAYVARPLGAGPFPGVVLLHYNAGWDEWQKEFGRRLAHHGYVTIVPNLHFREGKATAEENAKSFLASGGAYRVTDHEIGDVQGAIDYLRELPYLNGRIGVVGYCSGGRLAYLGACTLRGIDAVVCCYPGGVVPKADESSPNEPDICCPPETARRQRAPIDYTKDLQCPMLGLFGADDKQPSLADMAKMEEELKRFGKTYQFHAYENAGHVFFSTNRKEYRAHAAVDGWNRVFDWFGKYLR